MSDYISKSEVLDILYNTFEEYNMTTDKQDKHGGFGAEVFERVKDIPTLDEKEIIRNAFERVVERLEEEARNYKNGVLQKLYFETGVARSIQVVKEEGGIE